MPPIAHPLGVPPMPPIAHALGVPPILESLWAWHDLVDAVRLVDLNKDDRLDIAIVDSKRIVWLENPTWQGSSEIQLDQIDSQRRFIATVEPWWHGNTIVVCEEPSTDWEGTLWPRQVIDAQLKGGHAVAHHSVLVDALVWREFVNRYANGDKGHDPRGPELRFMISRHYRSAYHTRSRHPVVANTGRTAHWSRRHRR